MQEILDHHHHELRRGLLEVMRDDIFVPRYNISLR
jgi:hypothetical protein